LKTRNQITIDTFIVRPIVFFLNYFVRILGKLASIDHALDKDFKRIVVCKFKGMGSIIQATPMLQGLKNQFPNAEITFVTLKNNEEIIQLLPFIDKKIIVNDNSIFHSVWGIICCVSTLLRKRPELFIDLEIYSNISTLVGIGSLSKNRIGYYTKSESFNTGIYTHSLFFNTTKPISDFYFHVVRLFNQQVIKPEIFNLSNKEENIITNEKYIVINPNASDLRTERRWPKEKFIQIIEHLLTRYDDYQIILIGSKNEKKYTDAIAQQFHVNKVQSYAGKTSLQELISLISQAALLITNDTGPMHLGISCKINIISLFGPCSPNQYGNQLNNISLYKNVYCSPCVHDFKVAPCKGNNVCMQLIDNSLVEKAIEASLNNLPFSNFDTKTIYYTGNNTIGLVKL
jgi:ADP-heptose:LPS heptosyltransferase